VTLQEPQCGEMENAIRAFQRGTKNVGLHDIAARLENPHSRIAQRSGEVLGRATREIVENDDFPHVFANQLIHAVRSDQTSAADYDDFLASDVHTTGLSVHDFEKIASPDAIA
jgi:hypothetical protein